MIRKKNISEEIDVLDIITKEIGKVEKTLERVDEFYRKDLRKLDRLSDWIAEFGGSWKFISIYVLILIAWVVLNVGFLMVKPFDPYPFILLNLFLSMTAALQAPIILMAQNRAAHRDQTRVELDLEKDLRDLHVDEGSHKLLLEIKKDLEKVKRKVGVV
ncbi:MAG: DUF1003 domain-containing protein [Nanoarchaeota archaeon]|nr:DUF1003 domain-containing protein [Nanoarchaeota archaeon]